MWRSSTSARLAPVAPASLANITDEATPAGEPRSGTTPGHVRRHRPMVLHQPMNDATSALSGTASPDPAVGGLHPEPPQRLVGDRERRPPAPPSRTAPGADPRRWPRATTTGARTSAAATAEIVALDVGPWCPAGRGGAHGAFTRPRSAARHPSGPGTHQWASRPSPLGTMRASTVNDSSGPVVELGVGGGEERWAEPERHRPTDHHELDVEEAHHRGHGPARPAARAGHDLGRGLGRRSARSSAAMAVPEPRLRDNPGPTRTPRPSGSTMTWPI